MHKVCWNVFLCPCGCTRAVESTSFSVNHCCATAHRCAWAPSRLHRPRRHHKSATAAALFFFIRPHPLHILFSAFTSRVAQKAKKIKNKKNRWFSVRSSFHLASSAFPAKCRSQFFPTLVACRLLVPRTHPLTHLHHYSGGSGNPEESNDRAPLYTKVIIHQWCVVMRCINVSRERRLTHSRGWQESLERGLNKLADRILGTKTSYDSVQHRLLRCIQAESIIRALSSCSHTAHIEFLQLELVRFWLLPTLWRLHSAESLPSWVFFFCWCGLFCFALYLVFWGLVQCSSFVLDVNFYYIWILHIFICLLKSSAHNDEVKIIIILEKLFKV